MKAVPFCLVFVKPQKALAEVSRNTGIPVDRLTVGNQATLADTDIKRFKVIDSEDNTYSIFLDAAGNPVSEEVVNQITEAFHNKGFVGKLEVALNDLLKQGSNKPIRVIISLKDKEPMTPSRGRTPVERQANLNKLRDRYAAIEQPIVALLKANGQEVIYQSPFAPIVGASVSPQFTTNQSYCLRCNKSNRISSSWDKFS
jgi:hypothetical protein